MKREKKGFMRLDDSDFEILSILNRRSEEFSKLDFSDQMVLVWYLVHSPNRVKSWVDYIVNNYKQSCKFINTINLYDEIKGMLEG